MKQCYSDSRKRVLKLFGPALGASLSSKSIQRGYRNSSYSTTYSYTTQTKSATSDTSSSNDVLSTNPEEEEEKKFGEIPFTTEETDRILNLSNKEIPLNYTSKRIGPGGNRMTYIEGHRAIQIANYVFGALNWSSEIINLNVDHIEQINGKYCIICSAKVRITLKNGTYHEDTGVFIAYSSSKLQAMEVAKKGAVTDGRKRTLRLFGEVLGNCLYSKEFLLKLPHQNPNDSSVLQIETNSNHDHDEQPIKTMKINAFEQVYNNTPNINKSISYQPPSNQQNKSPQPVIIEKIDLENIYMSSTKKRKITNANKVLKPSNKVNEQQDVIYDDEQFIELYNQFSDEDLNALF